MNGSEECVCKNDYYGDKCQYPSPCKNRNVCNYHGDCVFNRLTGAALCQCYEGYYGVRCQLEEYNGILI